jgi:hypothetical protein
MQKPTSTVAVYYVVQRIEDILHEYYYGYSADNRPSVIRGLKEFVDELNHAMSQDEKNFLAWSKVEEEKQNA